MEHNARMASRSWLITGASSGLGNAFARAALGAGDLVTATARRPEALAGLTRQFPERVTAVPLDVRDAGQCQRAAETALAAHGRIDVLVNNAGYGIACAVEETTEEELRDEFDVPGRCQRVLRRQGSLGAGQRGPRRRGGAAGHRMTSTGPLR